MLDGIRSSSNYRKFAFTPRVLALAMALDAVASVRGANVAHASPGDIFDIAAPTIGTEPPKAADIQEGDASISTQTGALNYSFPIRVAPGRQGAQPHLALSYSSQAPVYGGIAAGWSLSIPVIDLDTTRGRLVNANFPATEKHYKSSMAGGRPLLRVEEAAPGGATAWRAQSDSGFVRYQRMSASISSPPGDGYWWRALAPDGTTYFFGDADHVSGCMNVSDEYAPLTRTQDAFGNVVDYIWGPGNGTDPNYGSEGFSGECRINQIVWGRNQGAGVGQFAAVTFHYNASPPSCAGISVGGQTSLRTGTRIVTGASELDSIVVEAAPPQAGNGFAWQGSSVEHTRTITLGYDAETASGSGGKHACFRQLDSISESASGNNAPAVTLPPITFTYGGATLASGPTQSAALTWPPATQTLLPWANDTSIEAYNLGWGFRDAGETWPTVEAMMVDLDGDGLIDRLTSVPSTEWDPLTNQTRTFCKARWERNLGPSHAPQFVDNGTFLLPTIKWASTGSYGGGLAPDQNSHERCALNYQLSAFMNQPDSHGCPCVDEGCCGTDGCPNSGTCANGRDCYNPSFPAPGTSAKTYLAYRWFDIDGDGLIDLVASPNVNGFYDLQQGTGLPEMCKPPAEPAYFGAFPTCPSAQFSIYTADVNTMCWGMHPWFIFKNHGNGVFGKRESASGYLPIPDAIQYQPMPLESQGADSSITSSPVGQIQGTVDLDGDGYIDAVTPVYQTTTEGTQNFPVQPNTWAVFLNSTSPSNASLLGKFSAAYGVYPYQFNNAFSSDDLNESRIMTCNLSENNIVQVQGLLDLNGDGLPEHWSTTVTPDCTVTQTAVEANDGAGFLEIGNITPRPATEAYADVDANRTTGNRLDTSRPIDLDLDGRVDVVTYDRISQNFTTYFNEGGLFAASAAVQSLVDTEGLFHRIYVFPFSGAVSSWEVKSDLMDLDGDGIPEGISFPSSTSEMDVSHVPTPTQPPRLLIGIDNHRGLTTSVAYSPMSDATAVTQDASTGKATPHTQWVVHSLTSTDAVANTISTTSYQYVDPHFSEDDQGHYAFRGFEEVSTTSPSGSVRVDRYSYDPDWSGRLRETVIHPAENLGLADTIDTTQWTAFSLFPTSTITTYHATLQEHRVCWNYQNEDDCRSAPSGYTQTAATFEACAPGLFSCAPTADSSAVIWEQTASVLRSGTVEADGDRQTLQTFGIVSDADTYRARAVRTTKQIRDTGSFEVFAQSETEWTNNFLTPEFEHVWLDYGDLTACTASQANCATTHRVFDPNTGNLVQRWKPEQYSANGPSATYDYDSRKLYVVAEHLESAGAYNLPEEIDYLYEYGTGAKLETIGPNIAPCFFAQAGCPQGSLPKEDHRIVVDGLGRTVQRYETFMEGPAYYSSFLVETNTFHDTNPSFVEHESAIGGAFGYAGQPTYFGHDETHLDGHGRPIEKVVSSNRDGLPSSAPSDAVTNYVYRNDGTLASVSLPDPTTNDASSVLYTYTFDSLGRPTTIRRPDASAGNQSGVNISYNGMYTTTTEVAGAAGGPVAITTTVKDSFGRLIEVDEEKDPGMPGHQCGPNCSPTWATTLYSYDAADNVQGVVDPEGFGTGLYHDLAGRRTSIARGFDRTWLYAYDKNGNLTSETVPGYAGDQSDITSFTTSIVYDALDRPTSKVIGDRHLPAADVALFGADHETFVYDASDQSQANSTGRLWYWASYGSPGGPQVMFWAPSFNAQGKLFQNYESTSGVAGLPQMYRHDLRFYTIGGQPGSIYNGDYAGTNSATNVFAGYDARNLPAYLYMLDDANPQAFYTFVQNTRNVAGLVTRQQPFGYLSPNGANWATVVDDWSYDKLGRVASQTVQVNGTLAAKQAFTYFGTDDPATLAQDLGPSNHQSFQFTFDVRHQLKHVDESSTTGNVFQANYGFGTAGRFAAASESATIAPNSEVRPRDVSYVYPALGGCPVPCTTEPNLYEIRNADPEEVWALTNNSDGTAYATFDFDPAGNQVVKCLGTITYGDTPAQDTCDSESWRYVYDGKDQLRRASHFDSASALLGSEEYWYGANGERRMTLKRDAAGNKTEVIWWIDDTETHYDGNGNPTYALTSVRLGGGVAGRVNRRSNGQVTVEWQYHGNGDNTLAAVDGVTGGVNTSLSYTPFGALIEAVDGGGIDGLDSHPRRFNDKFNDNVSKLTYYGARYYDGLTMTWTQSDPLYRFTPDAAWAHPRRGLLYTNDLNNPLRYVDPDGRQSVTWGQFFVDLGAGAGGGEAAATGTAAAATGVGLEALGPAGFALTLDDTQHVPSQVSASTQLADVTRITDSTPTAGEPAPIHITITAKDDAAPPPPMEAGRGRRGGRGERNWERKNSNPDKYKPRQGPDGKWYRIDPQTGKKIPVPPPPAGGGANAGAPGKGNETKGANAPGSNSNDATDSDTSETSDKAGTSQEVRPVECGIECTRAF